MSYANKYVAQLESDIDAVARSLCSEQYLLSKAC